MRNTALIIFNKKIVKSIFLFFTFFYLLFAALTPVQAEGNPFIVTTDTMQTGLTPQIGGEELSTASVDLANLTDITGAYYDSTLNRIVFIGTTNGTQQYNQDDMAVAIKSIFYNNTLPDVSITDDPNNPSSATAIVTYSSGTQNTNFGNVLFNSDYKYKQYAIGYDPSGNKITSAVTTYKSVVDRYLALQSTPVAGNESKYILSPQNVTLKVATSTGALSFTNLGMQASAQAVNQSNDPLWNQAANNFASDITTNYDQYAQESHSLAQAKQLAKIVSILKWVSDYGIQTDFHSIQTYTPQFVSTPTTVQKVATPTGGYSAQGEINYNTPNTYIPDDGYAASLKSSSQAVSSSKEDVSWTFTNGGQQYHAVSIAADAFKSLGGYGTSITDMSVSIAGDLNLDFQRRYSSFSNAQNGIGTGWDFMPARLYNNSYPQPLNIIACNNVLYLEKLAIDTPSGHETFTYNCSNGYVADDPSFHSTMVLNANGTTTITSVSQTKYIFNSSLQLTSILDKNGNAINYSYDGSGKLTSIADTKSHSLTIAYNAQNLISSVTDWTNRKVQYGYDTNGKLTSVTDPNGNATTYAYDTASRLSTVTDRTGQIILTNTYGVDNRIATLKNAANITQTNTYDNTNRIITQTDNNGRVVKTSYDAQARILQQTDPSNKSVVYTYGTESVPLTQTDKNGNKTTFTYDSHGNVTSVTYPDNTSASYTYDTNNRLTKILDNRYSPARENDYTYDSNGNLTQKTVGGLLTTYTYDAAGEMLTTTDPLNNTTTWTRDTLGNPLTQVDPYNKTTTYTYDGIGHLITQTDPNSVTISYTYDANGNLLTKTDAVGTTTNVFDKENRLTKTTYPNNTFNQYSYTTAGSLNTVTNQVNATTTYGYDAYQNLTSQQDALNHITTNMYNSLNQATQSATPLGKATKWTYDNNGNILSRIDANNKTTNYQYDNMNRLTKITYPDTSTITYNYDNRGNMTSMVDPNGTSSYTYDNFDRVTKATNPYNQSIQYTYDNNNNITQITYPDNKTVTYTYDKNNRMATVTDWNTKVTTYTYNNNGTLATRAYPNGITSYYTYDGANRLSTLEHKKGATSVAKFAYTRDLVGNIKIATESGQFFAATQTNTFTYDNAGKVTNAVYGYPQANITYTYDAVGNILSRSDSANFSSVSYTYDADNQMSTAGGSSYTYDNNGNQITRPANSTTLTYNFENNLTKFTNTFGTDTYKYDGLGNRIEGDEQGPNKTRYITDINNSISHVLEDYDLNFNQVNGWYEYGMGLIASWSNYSNSSSSHYYLEDGMSNTRFVTDSTGTSQATLDYDPYGRETYNSGNGSANYNFDEQHRDADTSFTYLRARYYDPLTGRFLTKDPVAGHLQLPITQNPYIYGVDNPINRDDPTGRDAEVAQILKNQVQGISFENTVLSVLGTAKNTLLLDKIFNANGLGRYIPDIANSEMIGEIKSGSYITLSKQLSAFISVANKYGLKFKLYVKPGVRLSQPLLDMIKKSGGEIITIGGTAAGSFATADFAVIIFPKGSLPIDQKSKKY